MLCCWKSHFISCSSLRGYAGSQPWYSEILHIYSVWSWDFLGATFLVVAAGGASGGGAGTSVLVVRVLLCATGGVLLVVVVLRILVVGLLWAVVVLVVFCIFVLLLFLMPNPTSQRRPTVSLALFWNILNMTCSASLGLGWFHCVTQ